MSVFIAYDKIKMVLMNSLFPTPITGYLPGEISYLTHQEVFFFFFNDYGLQ